MARELFPYAADRKIVASFLHGSGQLINSDHLIIVDTVNGSALRTVSTEATIAWFAPDGSLQCQVSGAFDALSTRRLINHICDTLGLPDRVEVASLPTRQFMSPPYPANLFSWQGYELPTGQPFVVAGPLTMQAWRAANAE